MTASGEEGKYAVFPLTEPRFLNQPVCGLVLTGPFLSLVGGTSRWWPLGSRED